MQYEPLDTFGNIYLPTFRDFQQDEGQLRLLMSKVYTEIANSVNLKETGVYDLVEVQNSQQFFTVGTGQKKRFAFRKLLTFGAIAAGGTSSLPHGITQFNPLTFVHIYGTAITAVPDFRPIPHASVTANANIEVIATNTTVTINVGAASPNVTSAIIVLEYLKN